MGVDMFHVAETNAPDPSNNKFSMNFSPNAESSLGKLVRLSLSIASDESLLQELSQEVKGNSIGPLSSMFKAIFKKNVLGEMGVFAEFSRFFFSTKCIQEITIYSAQSLGIKCFFMPASTCFPLHDHPNRVICTGILHGRIKYMALDKVHDDWYSLAQKATGLASDVLFCSKEIRNIHSILALEDSIILDIFLPNYDHNDDLGIFTIRKKRNREFQLEKRQFVYTPPGPVA